MLKKLGVFTMSAGLILGAGAGCVQSEAQQGDEKGKPDHAGLLKKKLKT